MLPEYWGRCWWKSIHCVTLGYPEHPTDLDKQNYYQFFNDLQYVLPCKKCANNWKNHLKKYPLTDEILSSRSNLVKWGIDMHNVVNYYTGKPMLTYEEAMHRINKSIYQKKSSLTNPIIYIIILLIIIIFLVYYIYHRNRPV
jgi:hypothetical protein